MSSTTPQLPKRPLGDTGLQVSCLGLGTVKIGRNQGVKYPQGFALPDDASVRNILALCRDAGMNLIDTAPAYGSSEERLGQLLENREDWVICSKVGEEFQNGTSSFDFSPEHVRHSLERSLKRLRTDYLDLVLVHSDGNDEDIIRNSGCFDALIRAKEAGLIRAFGMSTKTIAGGLLALEKADVVMVTLNPSASEDATVIAEAHARNKGVLIKKALNSGHVVADADGAFIDPVRASLEFVFSHAGVSSVIIGSITPRHLLHNIECAAAAAATTLP